MLPPLDQLAPAEAEVEVPHEAVEAPAAEAPAEPEAQAAPEPQAPAQPRRAEARPAARAQARPAASAYKSSPPPSNTPQPRAADRKPPEKKAPAKRPLSVLEESLQEEVTRMANIVRCSECGAKIPKGSRVCPQCGAVLSGLVKFIRRFGGFVMTGLAVFLLVTWPYKWPLFLAKRAVRPAEVRIQAEVLKFAIQNEADNNLRFVRGVVTNHAPVQLFDVKLEFTLADRNNGALSTLAMDQIKVLEPHKVWNFKALVLDPDAVGVKTNEITWTR